MSIYKTKTNSFEPFDLWARIQQIIENQLSKFHNPTLTPIWLVEKS